MKKLLIVLFLFVSLAIRGATYYVSTTGNDSNAGTIGSPWLTWQKGFYTISAGDILYIRGGTYTTTGFLSGSSYFGVRVSSHNGTFGSHIKVYAYPGEVPILDCSGMTTRASVHFGILLTNISYWDIKGLTLQRVREYTTGGTYPYPVAGWEFSDCENLTIDECTVRYCGNGFSHSGYANYIYYTNCDAYGNWDYYDNGGLANGFNINIDPASHVFYTACRAWKNSDDGWDAFGGDGYITIDSCWAFRNGNYGGMSGNGDGIKLGITGDNSHAKEAGVQRTVTRSLAFDNKLAGFDESQDYSAGCDMVLYNNIAYRNNYHGFIFQQSAGVGVTTLKNNIAYLHTWNYLGRLRNVVSTNTFLGTSPFGANPSYSVSEADFFSVDSAGVSGARQANGNLPLLAFLNLASTSELIDGGVTQGFGNDLGPFQYAAKGSPITPVVLTTSAISEITSTTATSGGNIIDDGSGTVSARGVCWDTSTGPTVSDAHTTDGSGTGLFDSAITGLSAGTTYYVRAYATNEAGTSYGGEVSFTPFSARFIMFR